MNSFFRIHFQTFFLYFVLQEYPVFAGPIFSREAVTVPRQLKHFLIRAGYVAGLMVLMYTAAQISYGWQEVRNVGDISRIGALVFQVFSMVELALVLFFALLLAAGRVAQEKDRRTLILLLMTDLSSRELVLGKLLSSFLIVSVMLAASIPVFAFVHLLGGVTSAQIGWSIGICASAAFAVGSWGSLVAYSREKTFQTLAISVLGSVLFLGILEAIIGFTGVNSVLGSYAAMLNPFRAMLTILDPLGQSMATGVAHVSAADSVSMFLILAVILNVATIVGLRIWNPPRSVHQQVSENESAESGVRTRKTREIWDNPVIWREIRTRAYGRKIFVIKLAYFVLAMFAGLYVVQNAESQVLVMGLISPAGFAFLGLTLISLMLINAQGVTALTSERDGQTLELLLVTDVTAKEFVFGKLGGVLYNSKELILIPLALIVYQTVQGGLSLENFVYVSVSFIVLLLFAAMLGLHSGLSFDNSRSGIITSLGTMFFLFIGIFIFMILLVEARGSFFLQFQSFILFIGAGSIGLWTSLTHKNPSPALSLAGGILPFLTFYAITEFLLGGTLGVCISLAMAYGFTTAAMLVPAISEFDVALGRSTAD